MTTTARQKRSGTRRPARFNRMYIVDVLPRGFLVKRSPGVEGTGDVYGAQDSAVVSGVETASGDSLENGPSSLTIETPQPEGTVAGRSLWLLFSSGGRRLRHRNPEART